MALTSKVVSFTPGFSPVTGARHRYKPFPTVFRCFAVETVKTVSEELKYLSTGLKPGVNETIFPRKAILHLVDQSITFGG